MDNPYDSGSQGANTASTQNLGALGTLIGYVGAEAATVHLFERLLWPQRFWNKFDLRNAVLTALFMPMGGPLHKAALETLDGFFDHGLFRGPRQGHMLGTAFFRDTKLPYTVWVDGEGVEHEHCRNNLWTRAVARVAVPELLPPAPPSDKSKEAGEAPVQRPVRARTSLNHVKLEQHALSPRAPRHPVVSHDTAAPTATVYLYVVLSELTAIAAGAAVAAAWRTWLACLWFVPLALKLAATALSLPREGLAAEPAAHTDAATRKTFEVRDPRTGIFLLEGTDAAVLQFFRHYGHPRRDRVRETALFGVVAALGLAFPLGLVCSVLWMPPAVQYVWLSYQLYATLAMHVYRYANSHHWASTEQAIADGFERCRRAGVAERVELRDGASGRGVTATLATTYYNNLKDAQGAAARMLGKTGGGKPVLVGRDSGGTMVEKEGEEKAK